MVVKLNASSESRVGFIWLWLNYIYSLSDDDMWKKRWTSRFNDLCVAVISKWGRLHFLSVFGHYIKCFLCLLRYINKMLLLTI